MRTALGLTLILLGSLVLSRPDGLLLAVGIIGCGVLLIEEDRPS